MYVCETEGEREGEREREKEREREVERERERSNKSYLTFSLLQIRSSVRYGWTVRLLAFTAWSNDVT